MHDNTKYITKATGKPPPARIYGISFWIIILENVLVCCIFIIREIVSFFYSTVESSGFVTWDISSWIISECLGFITYLSYIVIWSVMVFEKKTIRAISIFMKTVVINLSDSFWIFRKQMKMKACWIVLSTLI